MAKLPGIEFIDERPLEISLRGAPLALAVLVNNDRQRHNGGKNVVDVFLFEGEKLWPIARCVSIRTHSIISCMLETRDHFCVSGMWCCAKIKTRRRYLRTLSV